MIDPVRLRSTGDLRLRVESTVCDACTDLCWSVEVVGHDIAGTGAKSTWLYRPHIASMGLALAWLVSHLSPSAARLRTLDAQAYVLEHQLTLDVAPE